MPRAKQRTPELRDRLLEVAIATLSEEGIARFTTRRVAERAGTSVPAVYELFDDKAGLHALGCASVTPWPHEDIRHPTGGGNRLKTHGPALRDDERVVAFGVMGLPFAGGHYLAFRDFPATSFSPS